MYFYNPAGVAVKQDMTCEKVPCHKHENINPVHSVNLCTLFRVWCSRTSILNIQGLIRAQKKKKKKKKKKTQVIAFKVFVNEYLCKLK